MNVTITAAPLPTSFIGNPQQLIEALLDRLEVTVDGNSFVISDVQPDGNQGPWLKDGKQWWVWDETSSTYIPLDLSASTTQQIYIGDISAGAPDNTKYQLWVQLDGSTVNGLFYYTGSTTGWVQKSKELVAGSVTNLILADNAVTDTKIAPGAVTVSKIAGNLPLAKLASGSEGQVVSTVSGTAAWKTLISSSGNIGWANNTVTQWAHSLSAAPTYVRAVLVCVNANNGHAVGEEMDLPGSSVDPGSGRVPTVSADATYVSLAVSAYVGILTLSGTTVTGETGASNTDWKLKFYVGQF